MRYNNTTDIPDKLVAICVGFSIAPGVEIECVTIKNKMAGIVHGQWGWYFPGTREIVVIVPRVMNQYDVRKRYSHAKCILNSRSEFLVAVLAHELRHAWQCQCSGWSSEMLGDLRVKEIDAESAEIRQLMKWRELMGEHAKAANIEMKLG